MPTSLVDRVRTAAAVLRTERGQWWTRRGRWLLQALIAGLLVYQLSGIGWGRVLDALPHRPLFFVLLGLNYALLPLIEAPIYTTRWRTRYGSTFGASLRKRVYNDDFISYAGEGYLVWWGTERGVERPAALRDVRDVNILSSAVSFVGTLAAAGWALAAGVLGDGLPIGAGGLLALAAVPLVVLVVVVAALGRRAFALPAREAARITALHLVRLVGTSSTLVAMWHVAVPGVPFRVWAAFLATQLLVGRIPFLPGKDLLFVGAGVGMAGPLGVASASVAGALLVQVVAAKLLNLAVLVLPSKDPRPAPAEAPAPAAAPTPGR